MVALRPPGTALITGASGFVGGRLRERLLDEGWDVVALLRPSSPEPLRGRFVRADYEDPSALEHALAEAAPSFVFHAAGATKGVTLEDFRRGNVAPTAGLVRAIEALDLPLSRFVLLSSLAVYGPSSPERPHDEGSERSPVEFYGKSKLYGNRDRTTSMVYIDDLIDALIAAASEPSSLGRGYFISDGKPVSWSELQRAIAIASGRAKVRELDLPELLVSIAALGGEILSGLDGKPRLFNRQKAILGRQGAWTCRPDAARRDFGYEPRIELPRGAEMTFAWYRREGWL